MKWAKRRSRHRHLCWEGEVVYLESVVDRRLSPSARRDFDDVLLRYGEVLRAMAEENNERPDNQSEPTKRLIPRS